MAKARAETLRKNISGTVGKEAAYGDAIRWCLVTYLYSANPKRPIVEGPQVVWLIPIKHDGKVQPDQFGGAPALVRSPLNGGMDELETGPARSAYANAASVYLFPALFAYACFNSPLTRLVQVAKDSLGPKGKTYGADTEDREEILTTVGKAKEHGIVHTMLTCRDSFRR